MLIINLRDAMAELVGLAMLLSESKRVMNINININSPPVLSVQTTNIQTIQSRPAVCAPAEKINNLTAA